MSQDKFIELVTKEFTGELNPVEANELRSLLQDPVLKDQYAILTQYLSNQDADEASSDALFRSIQTKIAQRETAAVHPIKQKPSRLFYWKTALVASVILIFSIFIIQYQRQASIDQVAYTKRASKKSILLPDGTKVVLNSASKLLYPKEFTGKNRKVSLIGEAFFDVAKDSKHPFIIHTDKMEVRVLGTAFNLKSYPEDPFSETTLIRGAIEVALTDRSAGRITLKPSEKLIVRNSLSKEGKSPQKLPDNTLTKLTRFQTMDTTVVETSWMYDQLIFKEKTFLEISNMLERTYDVEIDFQNQHLKSLRFTAHFEKESLKDILKALSLVEPFSYKIQKNKIILQ